MCVCEFVWVESRRGWSRRAKRRGGGGRGVASCNDIVRPRGIGVLWGELKKIEKKYICVYCPSAHFLVFHEVLPFVIFLVIVRDALKV